MDNTKKEPADFFPRYPDELLTYVGTDLYLAKEEDGFFHWYTKDPMRVSDRRKYEIIPEVFFTDAFHRRPGIEGPILLRVSGIKINRTAGFNLAIPAEIRKGADMHIEDFSGNIVIMREIRSNDPQFPFVGNLYSFSGEPLGQRLYSLLGECEDGIKEHAITAVFGKCWFEVPDSEQM